jgi:hypothetical protein
MSTMSMAFCHAESDRPPRHRNHGLTAICGCAIVDGSHNDEQPYSHMNLHIEHCSPTPQGVLVSGELIDVDGIQRTGV